MRIAVLPGSHDALVIDVEGLGPLSYTEAERLVGRLRWALANARTRMHPAAPCSCNKWEPSEEAGYQRLAHDELACELIAVVEVPE